MFLLLQGSVYIIKESNLNFRRPDKISAEKNPQRRQTQVRSRTHRQSILRLLDYGPSIEKDGHTEEKAPSEWIEVNKDDPILSQEELLRSFPDHLILNILYAPNYFGEIALNECLPR